MKYSLINAQSVSTAKYINHFTTTNELQLSGFTFGEQFDFTHQNKVKINNLTYQHLLISSC